MTKHDVLELAGDIGVASIFSLTFFGIFAIFLL